MHIRNGAPRPPMNPIQERKPLSEHAKGGKPSLLSEHAKGSKLSPPTAKNTTAPQTSPTSTPHPAYNSTQTIGPPPSSNGAIQSRAVDYSGSLMSRSLGSQLNRPQLPPEDLAALREAQGTQQAQAVGNGAAVNPAGDRQQAYTNTCGVNTLMAMESAVSPERAELYNNLSPQERSSMEFAMMRGAGFQADQVFSRRGFEGHGSQPPAGVNPGRGLNQWGMRDELSNRFEGTATLVADKPQGEMVDKMIDALEAGSPVAIGTPGHWVTATDVRGESGREEVLVSDSWTGESHWVSRESLNDGSWARQFGGGEDSFMNGQGAIRSIVHPEPPARLSEESSSRQRQEDQYNRLHP